MKTILVSLNNHDFIKSQMLAANAIAKKHDSHIIGLYVVPSALTYSTSELGTTNIYAELRDHFEARATHSRELFEELIAAEGLNGEWRQVDTTDYLVEDSIVEHGRQADLIILGSQSPDSRKDNNTDMGSTVVQGSGRPVLFVPKTRARTFRLNKIVVGWDGSREASRAAFDALPLMKMGKKTHLLCVNPRKEMGYDTDVAGSELASALSRHGLKVNAESRKSRKRASALLLEQGETADMIVIGAYGHSRIRENILGGVTRSMLEDMNCPVLMSS